MLKNEEFILIFIVVVIILFLFVPKLYNKSEGFDGDLDVQGYDPYYHGQTMLQMRKKSDNESLIFDNTTGAVMSGTDFMKTTGLVTPKWIPPAWDPNAKGPSSKDYLDEKDFENDPRLIYGKCSLSCCAQQYPLPFDGWTDPFVYDKDGNHKYNTSSYLCNNNNGGIGCLCMTDRVVKDIGNGFVNHYTH